MWLLLSLGAAVLWGLNYLSAEKVMQKVSPLALMAVELSVSFLVIIALGVQGSFTTDIAKLRADPRLVGFILLSASTFTLAHLCIVYSIAGRNATLAGLVEVSYPLFIVIFAWLLFRESHFSPSIAIGAVLIFAGVGLIAWFDH